VGLIPWEVPSHHIRGTTGLFEQTLCKSASIEGVSFNTGRPIIIPWPRLDPEPGCNKDHGI
jgi:hypothetical protein